MTSELKGKLLTDGVVATSVMSGFDATSKVTVTQSTSFGMGLEISASLNFMMASIGTTISTSVTVANTKGSSVSKTSSTAVKNTVRMAPNYGETCSVQASQEVCTFTSEGALPVVASGWIWFEFNEEKKGFKIWGYFMDTMLDERARTVPVALSIAIDTKSNGKFESNCECLDEVCMKLKTNGTETIKPSRNSTEAYKGDALFADIEEFDTKHETDAEEVAPSLQRRNGKPHRLNIVKRDYILPQSQHVIAH